MGGGRGVPLTPAQQMVEKLAHLFLSSAFQNFPGGKLSLRERERERVVSLGPSKLEVWFAAMHCRCVWVEEEMNRK